MLILTRKDSVALDGVFYVSQGFKLCLLSFKKKISYHSFLKLRCHFFQRLEFPSCRLGMKLLMTASASSVTQ